MSQLKPIYGQFEEEVLLTGNLSPKQTEERVLRRLTLEILPFMHHWAEKKGEMTKMVLEQTTKNEKNYSQVDPEAWKNSLEDFLGKTLEVLILNNPLTLKELLARPEKNPISKRFLEIGERNAEEILLLTWNQKSGLIAASCRSIQETSIHFPSINTLITQKWPSPESTSDSDQQKTINLFLHLWVWDRKNFSKKS